VPAGGARWPPPPSRRSRRASPRADDSRASWPRPEALGALLQAGEHGIGYEPRDIAAEADDLLHESRARVEVRLARHHEDRLDLRLQVTVHHRHLELVLEVAGGAEATDDHGSALLGGVVDGETGERVGDHALPLAAERVLDHPDALLGGEPGRVLVRVERDADDDAV